MIVVALLLAITLSNQGYWLAGQEETIEARPAVSGLVSNGVIKWELRFAQAVLAHGETPLSAGDGCATIRLQAPEVRVRTKLEWNWSLSGEDGRRVSDGTSFIHVFPNDLMGGLSERLGDVRIVVVDEPAGLPSLLKQARIRHRVVAETSHLATATANIILVGGERLRGGPFVQSPLMAQAQAGCGVLICAQSKMRRLCEYPLVHRAAPVGLSWRREHALLNRFETTDLDDWFGPNTGTVTPLRLPADEPVLELAYWPRETPGRQPVPIDALLAVKAVGKGRIVFCQIPFCDWQSDARAQVFLVGALDYLLTSPEPTPPPSERPTTQPAPNDARPIIQIPAGVEP